MDSYRPIACDLHDYLEIACLYRYRLLLELEDGVRFEEMCIRDRMERRIEGGHFLPQAKPKDCGTAMREFADGLSTLTSRGFP